MSESCPKGQTERNRYRETSGIPPATFKRTTRRLGFTIVELLVVIGIIAALGAMLFPVFMISQRRAYESACLINLHQLGLAAQIYADDWDGLYPHAVDPHTKADVMSNPDATGLPAGPEEVAALPTYPEVLKQHLKSKEVLRCPADTGLFPTDDTSASINVFDAWGTSYGYNDGWAFLEVAPSLPSRTPIFWDASGQWHGPHAQDLASGYVYKNVLYADMHARLVEGSQLADDGAFTILMDEPRP